MKEGIKHKFFTDNLRLWVFKHNSHYLIDEIKILFDSDFLKMLYYQIK